MIVLRMPLLMLVKMQGFTINALTTVIMESLKKKKKINF